MRRENVGGAIGANGVRLKRTEIRHVHNTVPWSASTKYGMFVLYIRHGRNGNDHRLPLITSSRTHAGARLTIRYIWQQLWFLRRRKPFFAPIDVEGRVNYSV